MTIWNVTVSYGFHFTEYYVCNDLDLNDDRLIRDLNYSKDVYHKVQIRQPKTKGKNIKI